MDANVSWGLLCRGVNCRAPTDTMELAKQAVDFVPTIFRVIPPQVCATTGSVCRAINPHCAKRSVTMVFMGSAVNRHVVIVRIH